MTYEEALSYINKALKLGSKPGLYRITKTLEHLGNPQNKCNVIHVAGTNGKGSTTTMIANALQNAGFKVGKFMSPYVYEYGERICINNAMITPKEILYYIEKIKKVTDLTEFENLQPTEFEVNTLIAFLHYAENECDYVVLEVGLGGRLDATNVIENPLLNVITSISLDHTHILGDNVIDIAREKCGIIKDCPVICYPLQENGVIDVVKSFSKDVTVPNIDELKVLESDIFGSKIEFNEEKYDVLLAGEHQIYNAMTAIKACETLQKLGVKLTLTDIKKSLAETKINARMEIVSKNPMVIIDGSHNASGIDFLCKNIEKLEKNKKKCAIFGMLSDKDNENAIKMLENVFDTVIFTTVNSERAINADKLAEKSQKSDIITTNNVEEALKIAENKSFEITVICGSLYLAKDAKNYLTND